MPKICPSYPDQKGSEGMTQDGMSPAGSAQQANKDISGSSEGSKDESRSMKEVKDTNDY